MRKLALIVLSVVAIQAGAFAQAKAKRPTIAVLPFIIDESVRITIANQVLVPRVIETEFTSQVMEFLVKSRKFDVLERDYLRKILNENKLTESDWIKPGESQRIGKLLVSDYLVIGHIDRLLFTNRVVNIPLTGETQNNVTGTFKIHFRITEVKSGRVVFMQSMTEKLRSEDLRKTMEYKERKDMTLADFKDILFDRTAKKAGNFILEGIYPIKIASVQGTTVMLNRGEGAGITVGKQYEVFNAGEAVKDPDTGEVLGVEEMKVGVIEVTSVHPKFSKARIVQMTMPLARGGICRSFKAAGPVKAAPAYPRVSPGW